MNIPEDFLNEIDNLILSASGFRKVFSTSEESFSDTVSDANRLIAGVILWSFCEFMEGEETPGKILIATDARPTGHVLATVAGTVFRHFGAAYEYIGVAAAPEAMAFTAGSNGLKGFCYISASHNPVGHNGFKFGKRSGGVLTGGEAGEVIERIKSYFSNTEALLKIHTVLSENTDSVEINREEKQRSLENYSQFLLETAFGSHQGVIENFSRSINTHPVGIIGELNGSARGVSSDRDFLKSLSIDALFFNERPGEIVHGIVPEGENLTDCCTLLETQYNKDNRYIIGYVPDNDGDRGNIVYIDDKSGKAEILKAQEVFALSVLSELLYIRYLDALGLNAAGKCAVVVNGPTSMRIEEICSRLNTEVFRAEVGEANVVQLAWKKRNEGYTVRILGEGSNGGNITYPASVRDPLNTIMSFVKLLRLVGSDRIPGLFEDWCNILGIEYNAGFSLKDIIETLPKYTTTDAYEPLARMQITAHSHADLKLHYEKLLESGTYPFPESVTSSFGEIDYSIINYEGTELLEGAGNRTGSERGGFKLQLTRKKSGEPIGFVWMRGSGTEPVFRVMVDLKSPSAEVERELLHWHRTVVKAADAECQKMKEE